MRYEVHRFGISFHRNQRSKGTFVNELENIKGIGKQTATQLLKEFKSVKRIQTLTIDDLTVAVGRDKATRIWNNFNLQKEKKKKRGLDGNPAPF